MDLCVAAASWRREGGSLILPWWKGLQVVWKYVLEGFCFMGMVGLEKFHVLENIGPMILCVYEFSWLYEYVIGGTTLPSSFVDEYDSDASDRD